MAYSNQLQRRRGTKEEHASFIGAEGEITVITTMVNKDHELDPNNNSRFIDLFQLCVHDGRKIGGYPIPTEATMAQFVSKYIFSEQNLTAELRMKLYEIDNKISIQDANKLFYSKNENISIENMPKGFVEKVNSISKDLTSYKQLLQSNKAGNGSAYIGYAAKSSDFANPTEVDTVEKAINSVIQTNKNNTNTINTINGELRTIHSNIANNSSALAVSFKHINTLLEDVSGHTTDIANLDKKIDDVHKELVLEDTKIKTHMSKNIEALQAKDTELDDKIKNLKDTTYNKTEMNNIISGINSNAGDLSTNVDSIDERLSTAETKISQNIYTKEQTESKINESIHALIGNAPGVLDTLEELSAALGNDANFASNITKLINSKADLNNFNTLNDIVTNEETGLVPRTVKLERESTDYAQRIATIESVLNDATEGIIKRLKKLEDKYNQEISNEENGLITKVTKNIADIKELRKDVTSIETQLEELPPVAKTGLYKDLYEKPFIPNGYFKGNGVFSSTDGKEINLPTEFRTEDVSTYGVAIIPVENPNGTVGEIWVTKQNDKFTVYCSGNTRELRFDYILFRT